MSYFQIEEDERVIRELEGSLEHAAMERDRMMVQQQRDHEQRIQALMQQISQGGGGEGRMGTPGQIEKEAK